MREFFPKTPRVGSAWSVYAMARTYGRAHSRRVLAPFPFLDAVTERDRRWPRVAAMAAATPAAVMLLSLLFAIVLGILTGGAMFEDTGGPRLLRSAIYVLQLGLGLGVMGLAVILAARYVFGRPITTWMTVAPHFRWRLLLGGAALTVIGVGVLMLVDGLLRPGDFQLPLFDPNSSLALKGFYAVAVVAGLFVAATAEEVVFRGYLLQQTAAFTRNVWVLIAVNAVAFALAHLEFDPGALAARALAGAAFAWAALRLGGLEFAIGAHVATNLMIAFFQAPLLPDDPEVTGGLDETMIEVALAFYMVVVVELVRRSPWLMAPLASRTPTSSRA
jgi:membrane protease YdiL (CAAX protease family)